MIARLAWKQVQSEVNNNAFRQDPSAEHLSPAALQEIAQYIFRGWAADKRSVYDQGLKEIRLDWRLGVFPIHQRQIWHHVVQSSCFACHASERATDFVFTRYSP